MAQSIAVNSVVALIGRAVSLILGLVITAVISRTLGLDAFGTYTALVAFGSLILVAADLGLYLILTQHIGQQPDPATVTRVLSQTFWLRLLALCAVFGLGTVVIRFIPALAPHTDIWWIIAVGLSVQSISQLFIGVFQAHSSMWRATAGDIFGRLLQLASIMALPLMFVSGFSPLGIMALAFTLSSLGTFAIHRALLPLPWQLAQPRWRQWLPLLGQAWPIAVMLVLNAIYFRIDMLLLTILRSPAEVGAYGLAYRIIESALFIPAAFGGILLPHLSQRRRDSAASQRLLNEALQATAMVGAFTVSSLIVLAGPLVLFFSGSSFAASAPLLAMLSVALLSMFFGNLFGYTLVAHKRQRALMWLYLLLACFNLIANLIFVPIYGVFAAALTTVLTEITATIVAGLLVYRLIPYATSLSFLVRLAAATIATVAALTFLPSHLHVLIRLIVAGSIFLTLTVWLRIVHTKQFQTLLARS